MLAATDPDINRLLTSDCSILQYPSSYTGFTAVPHCFRRSRQTFPLQFVLQSHFAVCQISFKHHFRKLLTWKMKLACVVVLTVVVFVLWVLRATGGLCARSGAEQHTPPSQASSVTVKPPASCTQEVTSDLLVTLGHIRCGRLSTSKGFID